MPRRYVTVDVEVELDEFDTADLVAELQERGRYHGVGSDWLDRLRYFLMRGAAQDALAMVEAELHPRRQTEALELGNAAVH